MTVYFGSVWFVPSSTKQKKRLCQNYAIYLVSKYNFGKKQNVSLANLYLSFFFAMNNSCHCKKKKKGNIKNALEPNTCH